MCQIKKTNMIKINYLLITLTSFLFLGFENNIYSQYSKLEGEELELFYKEVISETKNSNDLLTFLELTIEESKFSNEKLENLKLVINNETHIWVSQNQLNIVVKKHLEKSEYAIIKKWLFDREIEILINNRFYVTKTTFK